MKLSIPEEFGACRIVVVCVVVEWWRQWQRQGGGDVVYLVLLLQQCAECEFCVKGRGTHKRAHTLGQIMFTPIEDNELPFCWTGPMIDITY